MNPHWLIQHSSLWNKRFSKCVCLGLCFFSFNQKGLTPSLYSFSPLQRCNRDTAAQCSWHQQTGWKKHYQERANLLHQLNSPRPGDKGLGERWNEKCVYSCSQQKLLFWSTFAPCLECSIEWMVGALCHLLAEWSSLLSMNFLMAPPSEMVVQGFHGLCISPI